MISLRYHVVSIAAVFLALALGVVLGSSAISERMLSGLVGDKDSLGKKVSELESDRNALNARLADADRFGASVGPLAVRGLLAQRTVVLVSAPDANQADRQAVAELLKGAGAVVNGEVQLADSFTDPAKADQLRDVVPRLLPAGAQLPVGATDPGSMAGGLLGALLLLNGQNQQQATQAEAAAAMSGLATGGFVRLGAPVRPAQLAVVLGGGTPSGEGAGDRAATLARFATQLDRSGAGAVLAGRAGCADGGGSISVVRSDSAAASVLSTVDNVDTPAGRAVTVLALREQLDGKSGRYGIAGNAQAPAPESAH